jgi:hypothetical protein
MDNQMPPKTTSLIQSIPMSGVWHSLHGIHAPMKAQARRVPPQVSTKQGPTKTSKFTLQGSQVICIIPSKSHLIQEPSKSVHQIFPFKSNKCSKTIKVLTHT